MGEGRSCFKILKGTPKVRRPQGNPRQRWEVGF